MNRPGDIPVSLVQIGLWSLGFESRLAVGAINIILLVTLAETVHLVNHRNKMRDSEQ